MKIAVDTNVLVRYLTLDDAGQAAAATAAIEGADAVQISTYDGSRQDAERRRPPQVTI